MHIRGITDKQTWESFIVSQPERTFLNSWNWAEIQNSLGEKIWRLGIFEDSELLGVALVIKVGARRGSFLFCPHGPSLSDSALRVSSFAPPTPSASDELGKAMLRPSEAPQSEGGADKKDLRFKALQTLADYLKILALREGCGFIRWNPLFENKEVNRTMLRKMGFRVAPMHIHPEVTWTLDITCSEEELLGKMRKTTRYLIRKGIRQNLKIEKYEKYNEKALQEFYTMYLDLAKKQHFTPFSFKYLKNEWASFGSDAILFIGRDEDAPKTGLPAKSSVKAGAFIVYWGKIGFYHHGASRGIDSNQAPYPYLIQWEAIKIAKQQGCTQYNFWGIAPDYDTKEHKSKKTKAPHPWDGLTMFKTGFGGEKREYIKTQDLPLSWKYWVNFAVEKMRARRRGY